MNESNVARNVQGRAYLPPSWLDVPSLFEKFLACSADWSESDRMGRCQESEKLKPTSRDRGTVVFESPVANIFCDKLLETSARLRIGIGCLLTAF
ncbi:MAG TPA: hypothetical protein VFS35_01985 [Terrimicrobiaceae bacterium]|nr:hypothetical protein [Terrimicrobiaceae bacterium]